MVKFKKLGDLCYISSGGTPKRTITDYWDNGKIPWVKISDIKSKHILNTDERITKQGLENSSAKLFPKDTIVYTIFATVGEVGILDITAATNQAIAGIQVKDRTQLRVDYLYYFLKSIKKSVQFLGRGVAQNNINLSVLKSISVPIPSFQEQTAIVKVLDSLNGQIKNKHKQLTLLSQLIKARFVEMFGDLKFDTSLSFYVNSLVAGKSLAGKQESPNKVLNTGAVSYDYFRNDSKNLPLDYVPLEKNQIQTSDLLISRMNTQELVGAVAYVWEAPKHTYLPDRLWKAKLKDNVNPIFIWQALIYPLSKIQIRRMATGTSGSMKNISKNNFLAVKIPYAKIQKQNEFANFVQQVDKSKFENIVYLNKTLSMKILSQLGDVSRD